MYWLNDFHDDGVRAIFRPFGHVTPGELADMTTLALDRAYRHGCRQILLDVTRMYGFESPGAAYRRWLVRRWSHAVLNQIEIAVVCRYEHISPERVGLITAMEEGLSAHVSAYEDEAVAWLDAARAVHH